MARAGEKTVNFCADAKLDYSFTLAVQAAMRALIDGDEPYLQEIANWLGRGAESLLVNPARLNYRPGSPSTQAQPVRLKPIGLGSAEQLIRLLAFLSGAAGYSGLFLAVDELELIAGLDARRRNNAFQTLRALLEVRETPRSTSLFLAATPQMFEDPRMFPSYKALQDRIEDVSMISSNGKITFKEPVINLDRTELGHEELKNLANDIVRLYRVADEEIDKDSLAKLPELVTAVNSRRYVIAKPRLLCRCTIDLLDGKFGPEISHGVALTSKRLQEEREKQIKGEK
jgi:hypothetical protein